MPTTKKNNLLEYKGHPLMRKENIIYYGSMSDSHIIMMQILESSDYKGLPVAKRVSVQLSADRSQRTYERAYRQENREEQHVGCDGYCIHLARQSTAHEVRLHRSLLRQCKGCFLPF